MSELTYKKIVDVEQVETLNDAATVFINDDGTMKQVAADKLSAVKTVNGVEPDENGDIVVNTAEKILFAYMPEMGDLSCAKTAAEIHELLSNGTTTHGLYFALRVYDFSNPMAPIPDYLYNRIEVESIQNGGTYYKLIYHIHFGDVVPPVLVDAIKNTITLDPDWVKPEENAGGSGGAFVVNLTPQVEGELYWFNADKTFEETLAACKAGQTVVFYNRMNTSEYESAEIAMVVNYLWAQGDNFGSIQASLIRYNGDAMTMVVYDFAEDGNVERATRDYGGSAPM